MKLKIFSLFFIVLQLYSICDVIDCRKIIDLLVEDPFDEAELEDKNYELIQFWYCNETENGRGLRIKRSDRNETWYIDEAPIIREKIPIWLVYNATRTVKADENIIGDAIKFYQQPELAMSVALQVDKYNHLYFTGSISKMKIVPLSQRAARSISQKKPHLFEKTLKPGTVDQANEFTISGYHVIYEPKREKPGDIILPRASDSEIINDRSRNKSKRSILHTVYPEILVVLDYGETYTSIYEVRFLNLLIYTLNFWNSVNLRFKQLSNPRVQLKITGIVVNMDRGAIPEMANALSSKGLNALKVLVWLPFWLAARIPKTYDIVVTQTNSQLCRTHKCRNSRHLLGMASWQFPCREQDFKPPSGIIHDEMHYSGIRAAVHEVGHLLGATDDGSDSSTECPEDKETVMVGHQGYLEQPFLWSSCSKREISNFLRSDAASCFRNESPSEDQGEFVELLSLPGSRESLARQCWDRMGTAPCRSEDVCKSLYCRYSIWCRNTGPALDGSPCPIGECRMGVCLPKVSNLTMNLQKSSSMDDP